jgi:preprotein translocase subunit SecG
MHSILLIVHILVAAALIGLILIQQGKGADMGAAFGSGASGTVFGSRGSASFLTRTTAVLAILFFVLTGLLAFTSTQKQDLKSVTELVAPAKKAPATSGDKPASAPVGTTTPSKPGGVPVVPDK